MNQHPQVDSYVAAAPGDQRPLVEAVRAMIRESLPSAEESFESKMPVYKIAGQWTSGFASRKKGVMFYMMRAHILDRFDARLGKLRSGKSCVELRDADLLPLAREILAEAAREASLPK